VLAIATTDRVHDDRRPTLEERGGDTRERGIGQGIDVGRSGVPGLPAEDGDADKRERDP
jgi:hypothetical protein